MKKLHLIIILSLTLFELFACAPPARQVEHSHRTISPDGLERITISQVLARLNRGEPIVFLDSRNDVDWGLADTKIPGAIRVGNNEQLNKLIVELPKDQFIVPYCT